LTGIASFDDFGAFESALQGWNPVFRKLAGGPFRGDLLQLAVGPIRVAYTRIQSGFEISGAAAVGFQSFGLPMPGSSEAWWCGKRTSEDAVSVYDASGSFEAATRPGFETFVFSAHPGHLAELGESLGIEGAGEVAPPGVTSCDPARMRRLRRSLSEVVAAVGGDPSLSGRASIQRAVEQGVPVQLLEALSERRDPPRPVTPDLRARALRRALDFIAAHPEEPLGVVDLCRQADTSERTLRRAFAEHLGVSPKRYLLARRLNGVHRELRRDTAVRVRVNDVAHCWGFWHMGQFAADYRRFFGELPSATISRSCVGRSTTQVT
jgi:AraC family ethanolamine operon transcriptional activator